MLDEDEFSVLEEMDEAKKRKNFKANINRKRLSDFEMDMLFLEE